MVPGTWWAICGCLLSSPGRRQSWRRPLNALLHSHPQGLRREIHAHGTRLEEVLERAGALASLRSPEAEAVRRGQEQLQSAWAGLREAAERRQQVLDAAFQVEQYYFDVAEVEAWLGEQELLMMSEDKGKVRPGWGCGGAWGRWSPGPAPASSSRAPCAPRTNRVPCSCSRSTCSWSRAWRTTRKASRSCRASAGRCWRWGTRTGGRAGDRGHAGARGRFLGNDPAGSGASLLEIGARPGLDIGVGVGSLTAPGWCFWILASGWGPGREERCAGMFEGVGPGALGFECRGGG